MLYRKLGVVLGSVLLVGSVAPLSAAAQSSDASSLEPAHLTLWHNYGLEANATATENLVKAFEAKYPQITIDVVSQPADNYFDLLQAAAISQTGALRQPVPRSCQTSMDVPNVKASSPA